MKQIKAKVAMVVCVWLAATAVGAAGNDAKAGIFLNTAPDGSVELSNQAADETSVPMTLEAQVDSAPTPEPAAQRASEASVPAQAAATGAPAESPEGQGKPLAETLSKIGATQVAKGNSAASRRYLMVDKASYLQQNAAK